VCVYVCVCVRACTHVHACACINGHILINYISSVGAQTAGQIETQIGTNTHWGNRHKLWEWARAARNRGGTSVPRKREAGEQARSAGVHKWNMAAQPPQARSASVRRAYRAGLIARSVEQNKYNLRNLRQTVRGSMRRAHLKTGMLK
jgi:hypothetical protein